MALLPVLQRFSTVASAEGDQPLGRQCLRARRRCLFFISVIAIRRMARHCPHRSKIRRATSASFSMISRPRCDRFGLPSASSASENISIVVVRRLVGHLEVPINPRILPRRSSSSD